MHDYFQIDGNHSGWKILCFMSWIQKPKLPSEEEVESGLLPPKPPSDPNKVQRGKATRTRLQQSTSVESSLSSEVKSRLDTSPSDGNCWYVVYLIGIQTYITSENYFSFEQYFQYDVLRISVYFWSKIFY